MPLILSFEDTAQRLANSFGQSIAWLGFDFNTRELARLKDEHGASDDSATKELVKRKHEENLRWNELFGPGGRFGLQPVKLYEADYHAKVFAPNDLDPDLEGLESVVLEQETGKDVANVVAERRKSFNEEEERQRISALVNKLKQ